MACESLEGRRLLSSLKEDVIQLAQDLYTIHQGSNVMAAQVRAVSSDLAAIAQVATKPDPSAVDALKADLQDALEDGAITPFEAATLVEDASAILASANIPKSLVQQTAADIGTLIESSGVTQQDVETIVGDVQAILIDLGSLRR